VELVGPQGLDKKNRKNPFFMSLRLHSRASVFYPVSHIMKLLYEMVGALYIKVCISKSLANCYSSISLSVEPDHLICQYNSGGIYSSQSLYKVINFRGNRSGPSTCNLEIPHPIQKYFSLINYFFFSTWGVCISKSSCNVKNWKMPAAAPAASGSHTAHCHLFPLPHQLAIEIQKITV
jgi:hypothetical protein